MFRKWRAGFDAFEHYHNAAASFCDAVRKICHTATIFFVKTGTCCLHHQVINAIDGLLIPLERTVGSAATSSPERRLICSLRTHVRAQRDDHGKAGRKDHH